jgi:hypothetical protein
MNSLKQEKERLCRELLCDRPNCMITRPHKPFEKPSLVKREMRLGFTCCEVTAYGYLTMRCWSCGKHTGQSVDDLGYEKGYHRSIPGADMSFSDQPRTIWSRNSGFTTGFYDSSLRDLRSPA